MRGWRNIHVTDGDQPYMKHWWVPGLQIGYEHTFMHQFADFVEAAAKGKSLPPTFRDGLATDHVTDAVLKSAQSTDSGKKWRDRTADPRGHPGRRRRGADAGRWWPRPRRRTAAGHW